MKRKSENNINNHNHEPHEKINNELVDGFSFIRPFEGMHNNKIN